MTYKIILQSRVITGDVFPLSFKYIIFLNTNCILYLLKLNILIWKFFDFQNFQGSKSVFLFLIVYASKIEMIFNGV